MIDCRMDCLGCCCCGHEEMIGVVPIVLDAINFVAVEHHQFRSYGGYKKANAHAYNQNNLWWRH